MSRSSKTEYSDVEMAGCLNEEMPGYHSGNDANESVENVVMFLDVEYMAGGSDRVAEKVPYIEWLQEVACEGRNVRVIFSMGVNANRRNRNLQWKWRIEKGWCYTRAYRGESGADRKLAKLMISMDFMQRVTEVICISGDNEFATSLAALKESATVRTFYVRPSTVSYTLFPASHEVLQLPTFEEWLAFVGEQDAI